MIRSRIQKFLGSSFGFCLASQDRGGLKLAQNTAQGFSTVSVQQNYDVAIIGGGSAGLAFALFGAKLGLKMVVFDYVIPSHQNSQWGLGGTCVNVGCIPKKLMHHSSLLGEAIINSHGYGWELGEFNQDANDPGILYKNFKWQVLRDNVQNYIKSLNFGYKSNLAQEGVTYINALAGFKDNNTLYFSNDLQKLKKAINTGDDSCEQVKFKYCVVCTGGRPTLLSTVDKYAITSDDLFSLKQAPGKTLVIGGGYVALECAGLLAGLGYPVTLMTRGLFLREFDQSIASMILDHVINHKKVKNIPTSLPTHVQITQDGRKKVWWKNIEDHNAHPQFDEFDTILLAVGRRANTEGLGLEKIGVKVNNKNRKIIGGQNDEVELTSVNNIYALGDVLDGCPELTPIAQKSAYLLAQRIAHKLGKLSLTEQEYENTKLDYTDYPTTVFTPLEYSCVGLSEEQAIKLIGEQNIEVYHSKFVPLEESITEKFDEEFQAIQNKVYCKVICDKTNGEKVLGIHYLGPNAGEVMQGSSYNQIIFNQGFAVAIKLGLQFKHLKRVVGIHPTCAEEFVLLKATKKSGEDFEKHGC